MWRVLVMSDTHGNSANIEAAITKTKTEIGMIHQVIHLGDIGSDARMLESLAGVPCYIVRGNTDYDNRLLATNVIHVGSHLIFATHGHRYDVNYNLSALRYAAMENGCDIAMYGHTHKPYLDINEEDVTILNPGSLSLPRQEGREKTFAILEINDNDEMKFEFYTI